MLTIKKEKQLQALTWLSKARLVKGPYSAALDLKPSDTKVCFTFPKAAVAHQEIEDMQ